MPADLEMLPVLALFLARVVSGYAICLALVGPRVTSGTWPRVSLFVIAGLAFAAFAAGAHWMSLVVGGLALLIERARTFSLPVLSNTWWMLPAGLGFWAAHEITYAGGWPPSVAGPTANADSVSGPTADAVGAPASVGLVPFQPKTSVTPNSARSRRSNAVTRWADL